MSDKKKVGADSRVLHHNDNDGRLAAYLIRKSENGDAICIECKHGEKTSFDKISKNNKVFVVDFDMPDEEWKELQEITDDIVWIDHHKTAMDKAKGKPRNKFEGIRKDGDSATLLTWEYLNDQTPPPKVVKLVDVFDVWKDKDEIWDDAVKFMFATKSGDTGPNTNYWNFLLSSDKLCEELVDKGEVIKAAFEKEWQDDLETGFEANFDGYKCFVLNTNVNAGSLIFCDKINDYDVVIKYHFDGEKYNYGLYTVKDDINIGNICAKYNGGGHQGCGGFTDTENYFEDD